MRAQLTKLITGTMDFASHWLPRLTGRLWVIGVCGLVYIAIIGFFWKVDLLTGDMRDVITIKEISGFEVGVLFAALAVLGTLYPLAKNGRWRSAAWLSLGAWATLLMLLSSLGAAFAFRFTEEQVLLAFTASQPATVFEAILGNATAIAEPFLHVRNYVVIALFAVVLEAHRRSLRKESSADGLPIGGRWSPFGAWLLAAVASILIWQFPPYAIIQSISARESNLLGLLDFPLKLVDVVLVWILGMAVYAWKTGAVLSVDEKRIRVGLAENGLGLFTIPWRRVLRVREVSQRGRGQSVAIEAGFPPVFRFRFSLHTSRDGGLALTRVLDEAKRQGVLIDSSAIRRGTAVAGWGLLLLAIAAILTGVLLVHSKAQALSDALITSTEGFADAGNYTLFGAITAVSALLLGLGLGFLFARTDASARPLPLIGVAVACSFLPDATIYWLVHIAIYAILAARLGPIETQAWIPYADSSVTDQALWLVGAKALFGVSGYLLAMMIAVKPWYRALPSWPYAVFWRRSRAKEPEGSLSPMVRPEPSKT